MRLRVGTFNLNNLFSRFNFSAQVDDDTDVQATTTFTFDDPTTFKLRAYRGRLVVGKSAEEREELSNRIREMDLDVIAVQEVEDVDTLAHFSREDLSDGGYRYVALVEGNDPRLIDVGLLSRLPLGAVTSWRHAVHPDAPGKPVFGRDLLEVEILNSSRSRRLITVYNNHLKSHFVAFGQDQAEGARSANERRRQQAQTVGAIVDAHMRPNSTFAVVGDMNDPPDSEFLEPMLARLPMVNGLIDAVENHPAPNDDPPAPARSWTHRYKPAGEPAHYELYDQVLLSERAADKLVGAGINRRTRLGGDGSDHDPAWVELDL